ncbi:MAG: 1,4-dihydroxy-2-naphthoate octaprenyltransferase [Chloroflexota bacterium]
MQANSAARPPVLTSWFWAVRPFSLSASVTPVLVGTALAALDEPTRWGLFLLALTGSLAIQVGTNLTDEYADHRRHGGAGKLLAPHKVIQRGALSERAVLVGLLTAFGYGTVAGLVIVVAVGWPILAVGAASVAVAYLYAGGPRPLGTLGLGAPVVFVFMGPLMVMAAYYVQVPQITLAGLLASLPVAFIVTAILHLNDLRDMSEDAQVGKHSVPRWIGYRASRWVYAALVLGAYVVIAALPAAGVLPGWSLLGLAPLPWAVDAVRKLWRAAERPAMNRLMVRSAKLHGWTGVCLALGLTLAAALG